MIIPAYHRDLIREAMAQFEPASASMAAVPLPVNQIYVPVSHKDVLDVEKTLVVGNRGTGKSVWSGVLADAKTRLEIASLYKDEQLKNLDVELGFHQSAGQTDGVAPSPRVLSALLRRGVDPEVIWLAVLVKGVSSFINESIALDFSEVVDWVADHPTKVEALLKKADTFFYNNGRKFLLVFDALDRMGKSWNEIRPLTKGVLILALNMQGYRCLRAKVFMRTDQYKDKEVFSFPDASKLRASRVDIAWHATELYGLFFQQLRTNSRSKVAFEKTYELVFGEKIRPYTKIMDPEDQRKMFYCIAGEFMGSDHRRGRTYTWLIDHLADAFHETTPRSFLVALRKAANSRLIPEDAVIDHHGIREGVQEASSIRVDQLSEDYPWIQSVLNDLEGLEVPCLAETFLKRWKDRKTIKAISDAESSLPGPVGLEHARVGREEILLESLLNIGIIEYRSASKINMPDIFRVAARIKRRGGVRTPVSIRAVS